MSRLWVRARQYHSRPSQRLMSLQVQMPAPAYRHWLPQQLEVGHRTENCRSDLRSATEPFARAFRHSQIQVGTHEFRHRIARAHPIALPLRQSGRPRLGRRARRLRCCCQPLQSRRVIARPPRRLDQLALATQLRFHARQHCPNLQSGWQHCLGQFGGSGHGYDGYYRHNRQQQGYWRCGLP